MYLDIFKNFFANTQEKTFAMIKGGVSRLSIASNIYKIPAKNINVYPTAGTSVGSFDESDNWQLYWENVKVLGKKNGSEVITTMADLSTDPTGKTITIDKVASVITEIVDVEFDKNIVKYIKPIIARYDLKLLDQIRDVVLHKKGNETLDLIGDNLSTTNNGSEELKAMFNDLIDSQANKLGGMLLKTYDSDIFNNWVKTDWIDGLGGIT